jgi:hypothetical protein
MIKPKSLPYDVMEWLQKPFAERLKMINQAWAIQGYGSPPLVYMFYLLKIFGYIAGWVWFCSFTPGMGSWSDFSWAWSPVAFQKAIAWSALFEVLGFGCGSGPLTARFVPPFGGFLYWLRPGTMKLPIRLFENVPVIGGSKRTILDVALYGLLLYFLTMSLIHPQPGYDQWLPIIAILPVIGILDRTIFLAARSEHFWVMMVVFAFATNWIAGALWVQLALWFFAGFSKLNHHFPTVVCVMTSNGPFTPWAWFRKSMYKDYPNDLNPSKNAVFHARMGAGLEFGVAFVLGAGILSGSTTVLWVGLALMLLLHTYILSNVPMGVPLEWNVIVVYGGLFFFYAQGVVSPVNPLDFGPLPVVLFVFVWSFLIPVIGNIRPPWISFLLAMRYYAGNWPASVWLFKKDSAEKLKKLTRSSPLILDQLRMLYDEPMALGVASRVMAFRLMHLHGRGIRTVLPKAVAPEVFNDYLWLDGEVVAGLALGWNFGDGHLHHEQLLRAIQEKCQFEEGELRCVFVEGQSLIDQKLPWRIADAKTGAIDQGDLDIRELRKIQAWPE